MKLSRETYGLVLISFLLLGGLYLGAAFTESSFFARLAELPWMLSILNGFTISVMFYSLYRSMSPVGKRILRDHPLLTMVWLLPWIVLAAVLVAQNERYTFENRVFGIALSFFIVLMHGWSLITLVEKWHTPDRSTWLLIAGLSFISAIISVYIFAGLN